MKVKNLLVEDTFIEALITELIDHNISYVFIKNPVYSEIHFGKNIYRFVKYDVQSIKMFHLLFPSDKAKDTFDCSLCENKQPRLKKEKPGYKKLNKRMIKMQTKRTNPFGYK